LRSKPLANTLNRRESLEFGEFPGIFAIEKQFDSRIEEIRIPRQLTCILGLIFLSLGVNFGGVNRNITTKLGILFCKKIVSRLPLQPQLEIESASIVLLGQ